MDEFITFVMHSKVESLDNRPKYKAYFFLRVLYYSIALFFSIAFFHEISVYLQTENLNATILGRIAYLFEAKNIYFETIRILSLPIITALIFFQCISDFSLNRVSLSFSLILSYFTCYIGLNLVKTTVLFSNPITYFVFFTLFSVAYFLILKNVLSDKQIVRFSQIWDKYLLIITYVYIVAFCLFMMTQITNDLFSETCSILIFTSMGFILAFVRRVLGLNYAISLNYIFLLPLIFIIFH